MPNDRRIRENILVPTGKVAPEDIYIYSLDGQEASLNDEIGIGDLVLYDKRTNRTVKKGVTVKDIPKLSVAVAIDPQGLGYPTRLRHVFGKQLDGCAIDSVTTEPGSCGCNGVTDFLTECTFQGTSYSLTIQSRGDRTLERELWNRWESDTFTVNLKNYSCSDCEYGIDCMAVMCAMANKINNKGEKSSVKRVGAFMKRALKQQKKDRGYMAYPLFENDYTYTISHFDGTCENCVHITGIGGIAIDGAAPIMFKGTTLAADSTKSLKGKQQRIVALINKAFKDSKIQGSAVLKQQLVGTAAPCCGFKILINSCKEVALVDGAGTPITDFVKSNPYVREFTKSADCVGCTDDITFAPKCGIRVVALAQKVTCDCDDPVDLTSWYHREVRIVVPQTNDNWSRFVTVQTQKPLPPKNLGVQWRKRLLNMDNGGEGYDYEPYSNDMVGVYSKQRKGTAIKEAIKGLACDAIVCSINIQHGLNYNEKSVNGSRNQARGRSVILINNRNEDLYNEIKEYLDPWLASLSCGNFGPLQCAVDIDQVNATDYTDTAGGVPDGAANADDNLGGTADGTASGLAAGDDDATGDGVNDQANNDLGS